MNMENATRLYLLKLLRDAQGKASHALDFAIEMKDMESSLKLVMELDLIHDAKLELRK